MRGSQTSVSFRFGEFFTRFSRCPVSTPAICSRLWEDRPWLRVSFVEVNVFNFAENGERRENGERVSGRGGETMTTRRNENDGDHDDDDLARLLSGSDQPASSFSTFYCRETRRLLRHESTTSCGGWKAVEKGSTNRFLKNHHCRKPI